MSEGGPLVNIPDLSTPATVLIEKVSDAVGGICKPWQIRRVAKAEAEAEKIKALAQIDITELQQRALIRLVHEEGRRQENIESITAQAIPDLRPEAKPEELDNDWLAHFFERCRLVSDKEMQSLWARLLAGQANAPNSISRRTIELVSTLDKADAHLFTALCGFSFNLGIMTPAVYEPSDEIYTRAGINFSALTHLDSIGLISFQNLTPLVEYGKPQRFEIGYFGKTVVVEFENARRGNFPLGKLLLTRAGEELAPLCGAKEVPGFLEYVQQHLKQRGIKFSIE